MELEYLEEIVGRPIAEDDNYEEIFSQADKGYMLEKLCQYLKAYRHITHIEIADRLRGIKRNMAAVELAKCYVHFLQHICDIEIADKLSGDSSYSELIHKIIYDTYSIMTHQFYHHIDTSYYYEAMAEASGYSMAGLKYDDLPQYELLNNEENQKRFKKFKMDFASAFLEAAGIKAEESDIGIVKPIEQSTNDD